MSIGDVVREVLQAGFRMVPWPTEPGIRAVGKPDRLSPVLVTGNYDLTVRRLVRAVRGIDAWIVVAPSKGINVWCAASGGHLSTTQIVTALKTSGIADRVSHRRAVLPQLAATGVRAVEVARRCGWTVRFGPAYAVDIPAYLAAGQQKTDAMRRVHFDTTERIEMVAAWAVPTTVLLALVVLPFRPSWLAPLIGLCWTMTAAVFFAYHRLSVHPRVVLATVFAAVSAAAVLLTGGGTGAFAAGTGAALFFTAVLTFDVAGSTPTAVPEEFETRHWRITLDSERCKGVYTCWDVCPEACFEKQSDVRKIELAHSDRCIRCGACVVQCPVDALSFEDEAGVRIEPEVIRKFKMNLLGKRSVAAPP
jgi:NAD-dependent dihydropyrimidine dehydrogenase PreA subunit